jgi:hypothetical protein
MLDDLIDITQSEEIGENGFIQLIEMWLDEAVIKLSIDLYSGDGNNDQSWEVECVGPLDHLVSLGQCDVHLYFDHELLWPYVYPETSLSFHGKANDPFAVVGALYTRHVGLVGTWIPFERFINGKPLEMIRGRFGMLAKGPLPLVQAYAQVLESFGVSTGLTEPQPAPYTNDEAAGLEEIAALLLNQGSFIIAPKFHARRVR